MFKLVKKIINAARWRLRNFIKEYKAKKRLHEFVSIKCANSSKGNVLVAYVIDPFLLKKGEQISNKHTHFWESKQIVDTFLAFGYDVDVIDYRNFKFKPKKNYAYFVAARTNFEYISKQLDEACVKIAHLDMAHWIFNNRSAYNRIADLKERRGVASKNVKLQEINRAIECADYATVLGNRFTIDTYRYAGKEIYRTRISTCDRYPFPESKDYDRCRKNFLWMGSKGLVHKGLDLVIEAFSEMPDYHLFIFGPVKQEKDFEQIYYDELYHLDNIHMEGWIDVSSQDFVDMANHCIAMVYPSCAEGGGGSVVNCMHAGLIPIVSYESSVDIDEFGILLKENSIDEIRRSVKSLSRLPEEEIKKMSFESWKYANEKHTRKNFALEYREAIRKIMDQGKMNNRGKISENLV